MIGLALGAAGDAGAAALADDPGIGDALRAAASVEGALATCDVIGGTAPTRVAAALAAARALARRLVHDPERGGDGEQLVAVVEVEDDPIPALAERPGRDALASGRRIEDGRPSTAVST